MNNVLITGGAGFIGSHLVELIRNNNPDIKITVFDNLSIGSHNVNLLNKNRVNLVIGDIGSKENIDEINRKFDVIYHLAAMNRAPRSIKDPLKSNQDNITGTVFLLELARKLDCKFIFSSSSSVFGHLKIMPRPENSNEFLPSHPYGLGKMASEHYCRLYNELYGLDTRIIRYFAVYGPRQTPKLTYSAVIPKFINALLNDQSITIYGGEQSRNFTYVKDTVEATYILGEAEKVKNRVFQVGGKEEITINELVNYLEKISARKIDKIYTDYQQGDIFKSIPDMNNLKEEFNFELKYSFKEGLTEMYNWLKENSNFFN